MQNYVQQAKTLLGTLPPSRYRDSLEGLIQYTIERSK
jgi:octaprenyl-diphosphate synthase